MIQQQKTKGGRRAAEDTAVHRPVAERTAKASKWREKIGKIKGHSRRSWWRVLSAVKPRESIDIIIG